MDVYLGYANKKLTQGIAKQVIVGLTGGIGSGKTTVANLFAQNYNIEIICADKIARAVGMEPEVIEQIAKVFGHHIVKNGQLNRKALRQIISTDIKAQQKLNAIMHPIIRQRLVEKTQQSQSIYTLVDIPLLDKKTLAFYSYLNKVICVLAPLQARIKRVMQRDNQTKIQVTSLIDKQITDNERQAFSDYVINNTELSALPAQVEHIHLDLLTHVQQT